MTVRSKILVAPIVLTPGLAQFFGPPAGKTWVLRSVVLCNSGGNACAFDIGIDGLTAASRISTGLTVPANGRRVFEERWYIPFGHNLRVQNNSGTTSFTLTIFGAELEGVA